MTTEIFGVIMCFWGSALQALTCASGLGKNRNLPQSENVYNEIYILKLGISVVDLRFRYVAVIL